MSHALPTPFMWGDDAIKGCQAVLVAALNCATKDAHFCLTMYSVQHILCDTMYVTSSDPNILATRVSALTAVTGMQKRQE
jgi:hypothetical protein